MLPIFLNHKPPRFIAYIAGKNSFDVLMESLLANAETRKILLSRFERNLVRAAFIPRVEQLNGVVLPKTHVADFVVPWPDAER